MRLFFAVDLPATIKAALGRLGSGDDTGSYRWVDPQGMHVTLAFLGEQPADRLDTLASIADATAIEHTPTTLRLGAPGIFGRPREPRVLLVDLAGDVDSLEQLQRDLAARLRVAGFALDDRSFTPHITVARRRPQARGGPPPGWPPPHLPTTRIPLDGIVLFQSQLSPRGATYTAVHRADLAAAAPE